MARDFLFWRHLRVLRARGMRHIHHLAARLGGTGHARPVMTAYNVRMIPNWSDRTFAYCHYGTYGPYLADLLAAIDRPFLFLDIGANQGLFSLIAARNPFCQAVVALEPVPDTYARLARNFAENGIGAPSHALPFGISERAGVHHMAVNRSHSGIATLEGHLARLGPRALHVAVEMRTVAELAPHLLDDLPIFVKIDVEGHEAHVIAPLLASSLAGRIMALFYEHDRNWSSHTAIALLLAKAGFGISRRYGRDHHHDVLALPLDPQDALAATTARPGE
jgi:FkbM family methyltransferase